MPRTSQDLRARRHRRIRKHLAGSEQAPRLCVFRSLQHISVQLIDDSKGSTICSASTLESDMKSKYGGNLNAAKEVGKLISNRAKEKGIEKVVFDRGGFQYAGRVKALADAAREGGLKF